MPPSPNKLSRFWKELKRRRVIHVIIVYATAAFVIIELTSIVAPSLGLPDWTLNFIIILLCIGFPFAIIFSWIYDITLKGIRKTESIELADKKGKDVSASDKESRFENSIAVLPFEDMSPQKDQEYFCDGITEELINVLAHVESLKVIARTSSFAFKGKQKDMREIGKKLAVETLLEGSIRKDGNRLRITAQLIKVADGSHLWSEKFDREIDDVFAIQDEISLAIVDVLKVKLLGQEKALMVKRPTEDTEAYTLYLKGIYYNSMQTADGMKKALEFYEKALQKDPNFALVYFGISSIYWVNSYFGNSPPNSAYPKVKEYTQKGLEIDAPLAEAHSTLSIINMFYDWNWKLAERYAKQALRLNPNSQWAHFIYSWFLSLTGRQSEAIVEGGKALELDPLSNTINCESGQRYFFDGQYDKAIEILQWTVTMYPNYFVPYWHLGQNFRAKLLYKKAIEMFENAIELSGGSPVIISWLAVTFYETGEVERSEKLIEELKQRMKNEYVPPMGIYFYYLINGDLDVAFEWLERAIYEHDSLLPWFLVSPIERDRVPDEERFKALLKGAGFEKYRSNISIINLLS